MVVDSRIRSHIREDKTFTMPRPGFPPTPASSTEIYGKEHGEAIEDFTLGPAALHTISTASAAQQRGDRRESNADVQASPTGGMKRKRRSMNADMQIASQSIASDAGAFSLPPPPSRSRKIIQVQPEDASKSTSKSSSQLAHGRKRSESGKSGTSAAGPSGVAGPSHKSTAASRRTARKTAHSIIERRRRSKMNDEFETLKELVPAARGQNMHKLAILQAGIEYVRYLEDCIHGLKGARQQSGASSFKGTPMQLPADLHQRPAKADTSMHNDEMEDDDDENDDDDDDMDEDDAEDSERETEEPTMGSTPRASRPGSMHKSVSNTPSPAIYPLNSHASISSYALSTGSPSPAILPSYKTAYSTTTGSSTLPSPALLPHDYKAPLAANTHGATVRLNGSSAIDYHSLQVHAKKALAYHGEADQEVIATLTMMGTERRRSQEEKDRMDGTRGMSVRDLLST